MTLYKVNFTRTFLKQYKILTQKLQAKTDKQILLLSQNPQHPSLYARKMTSSEYWEGRVDYHHRFVFLLEDQSITLMFVGTHQIYRKVS